MRLSSGVTDRTARIWRYKANVDALRGLSRSDINISRQCLKRLTTESGRFLPTPLVLYTALCRMKIKPAFLQFLKHHVRYKIVFVHRFLFAEKNSKHKNNTMMTSTCTARWPLRHAVLSDKYITDKYHKNEVFTLVKCIR